MNLQTDYVPTLEFDHVRVEIDGGERHEVVISGRDNFTRPRFVTTYPTAARGQRTITLTLLRASREVAKRNIEIPFTGNYLATIVITRSCATILCARGESCLGARCVPDACVTGSEPVCPAPLCTVDAMCTSATACAHGECVHGACLQVPTAGVCAASEACLPGTGCVAIDAPDAPLDAMSVPPDAFVPAPSFTLYRLPAAATAWSIITPTGDYPTETVQAVFTAMDGTLRVLTHAEIFTMSTSGVFSGRASRDALFPELTGQLIEAADRVGSTLAIFHNEYSTYSWSDTTTPVFVNTIAISELPAAWRGTFAPPTYTIHAFYSAPENAHGWAVPEAGAPCGVTGAYSEIVSFSGIGPSAMQDAVYSEDCEQFVAVRDYGESLPFTFAGAPPDSRVDAISYADGLWVFTR